MPGLKDQLASGASKQYSHAWHPPPLPPLVVSRAFSTRRVWYRGSPPETCLEWDYSPLPLSEPGAHAQRRISVCLFVVAGRGWVRVAEGDHTKNKFHAITQAIFQGEDQLEQLLLDARSTYFKVVTNPTN